MRNLLCIISSIITIQLAYSADRSYPVSEVNIGAFNTIYNLNITGYSSGDALNIYHPNGSENEDWRINYINEGVYEIENSTTGTLVSVGADNIARLGDQANDNSQRWQIVGVTKDFLGEYLYYKIINVGNSKALSYTGTSVTTETYTGAENQLWRLDLDGLEGFGAMCEVNEGIKASTIGGLLGPTVFVSNLTDLRNELGKEGPLTVVLTSNLNCINQGNDIRIDDYKTLIGSYDANTLTDARFVTNYYGWAYPPENPGPPSDNIVIKNLTFPVEGREDVIVLQVYSGKNVWIDHNTFYSTLTKDRDEVGKFVWINTSSDGPDKFRNPDFITLSYNILRNRYWCVAYGTQNDDTHEDRTTVAFNLWDSNIRRTPQIGNGTMHTYNNFNINNSPSTDHAGYANVITGAGSFVYAEANRFENFKKESSGYWDEEYVMGTEPFKDVGSYTNKSESGSSSVTPYLWSTNKTPPTLNWTPRSNYSYKVLKAYDPSGQYDAKIFTNNYSGSQNTKSNFYYVTDQQVGDFVSESISHPTLVDVVRDCAGVENGEAYIDQCGICVSGTTGKTACLGALQGEAFCEANGIFEDKNIGYGGSGYLNLDNAIETKATWYLRSNSTKTASVGIRYANGSNTARAFTIEINGRLQATVEGLPTGAWTTWTEQYVNLNLQKGNNQITLTSLTNDGAPNIDVFILNDLELSSSGCEADCNGEIGGLAFYDSCNTCVGGTTNLEPCIQDCEGTWGGTTVTDECGVCLTDHTIRPCSGSIEAETACSFDGTIDNNNEGFSGEGFVNTINEIHASASWVLTSSANQEATITFRYANGGTTSRNGSISLNGVNVGTLILAPTGTWTTWHNASVNLNLNQGGNDIAISATTADGLANLDIIHFSEGVSDDQCGLITSSKETLDQNLKLYPNPVQNELHLSQLSKWTLINSLGDTIQHGKSKLINTSDLKTGLYLLQVKNFVYKIIKE